MHFLALSLDLGTDLSQEGALAKTRSPMESSGRRKLPPKNMFYEVENWSLFLQIDSKTGKLQKNWGNSIVNPTSLDPPLLLYFSFSPECKCQVLIPPRMYNCAQYVCLPKILCNFMLFVALCEGDMTRHLPGLQHGPCFASSQLVHVH